MPEGTWKRQEKKWVRDHLFRKTWTRRRRADDRGRQKDRMSANHPLTPASSRINGDPRRQMLMRIPRKGDRREWPEAAFNCGFRIVDCGLSIENLRKSAESADQAFFVFFVPSWLSSSVSPRSNSGSLEISAVLRVVCLRLGRARGPAPTGVRVALRRGGRGSRRGS